MSVSVRASRRSVLLGLTAATAFAPAAVARPSAWPAASALARRYVAERKVAGVALAILHGSAEPRYLNFGAQAFDEARANERTIWRVYSMTKPVTGLAMTLLEADGVLKLDQPVSDFLPKFARLDVLENGARRPAQKPMLISHLLTHTAGLGYHINRDNSLGALYTAAGLKPGDPSPARDGERAPPTSLAEFGDRLAEMPLFAEPGTVYSYSVGLDLAGLVIERASGMPFETFLKRRIFEPLGMADTGFVAPPSSKARLSANYYVSAEGVRALEQTGPSPYLSAPRYPSGGGGLLSTAADYIRFNRALLNDGVLSGRQWISAAAVRRACSNLLPPGVESWNGGAFGAGMGITTEKTAEAGREPAGSYGWAGAAGTLMWNDPSNRLGVVMMTQYMPSNAYPIWEEMRTAVYRDLAAR